MSRSLSPLRPRGESIVIDERYGRHYIGEQLYRQEAEYMSREVAEHIHRNRGRSPTR